ncbi:MAG: hypothetical protein ACI4HI_08395 [Lachnospiraceae bacterium]
MSVTDFIEKEKDREIGYCACLVQEDGSIVEIEKGHLGALVELYGDETILSKLPQDVAPMFWLIEKTNVVVVDYENQIYSEDMTQEQRKALIALSDAKRIRVHLFDIHGKYKI